MRVDEDVERGGWEKDKGEEEEEEEDYGIPLVNWVRLPAFRVRESMRTF